MPLGLSVPSVESVVSAVWAMALEDVARKTSRCKIAVQIRKAEEEEEDFGKTDGTHAGCANASPLRRRLNLTQRCAGSVVPGADFGPGGRKLKLELRAELRTGVILRPRGSNQRACGGFAAEPAYLSENVNY